MNHSSISFPICVVLSAIASVASVGTVGRCQITSTWTGQVGDSQWGNDGNWTNSPNMGGFPNNSDQFSYNAVVEAAVIDLDQRIEIDDLMLGINPTLGGFVRGSQTLTTKGTSTVKNLGGLLVGTGSTSGGTWDAMGPVAVEGLLDVTGWTINANGGLAVGVPDMEGSTGRDGGIVLEGDAKLNLNGGLTFPRDGSILSAGGSPEIVNNGVFEKTGATSLRSESVVGVSFLDNGGTIAADVGTLVFNSEVTLNDSKIQTVLADDDSTGQVRFAGPTTLNGNVSVAVTNSDISGTSFVELFGGQYTLNGTLTNSGPGIVQLDGDLGGGTLAVRFSMLGGQIGTNGTMNKAVMNTGSFDWLGGEITGGGLINRNNVSVGEFSNGNVSRNIRNGTLQNDGNLFVFGGFTLQTNGTLVNNKTLVLAGKTIGASTTDANTYISNPGTIHSTGSSQINTRLTSTGTIKVQDGELRIGGIATIQGTVRLEPSGTTFTLGSMAGSQSILDGTMFDMSLENAEDRVLLLGGTNSLRGTLQSTGSGQILFNGSLATVQVESQESAELAMSESAPFTFDTASNTAFLHLDGKLTNSGSFQWQSGIVRGPQSLVNTGSLRVTGLGTISDGTMGGTVDNQGTITLSAANGGVILRNGGVLMNSEMGVIDFTGDADVVATSGANRATIKFENQAEIRKSKGFVSSIAVPFTQSKGAINVRSGTLQVGPDAELRGGAINVATDPMADAAAIFKVDGPSRTEIVDFNFNNGTVQYGTGVHQLRGVIQGRGTNGTLRFGGTMRTVNSVTLDVSGDDVFLEHVNGVLDGPGDATNRGVYLFEGGSIINGQFTNRGTFNWVGGAIGTKFNHEAAEEGGTDPVMVIEGPGSPLLFTSAMLVNRGAITHRNTTVVLDNGAKIMNEASGTYTFPELGGNIAPASVSVTGTAFENKGTIRVLRTASDTMTASTIGISLVDDDGTIELAAEKSAGPSRLNVTGEYTLRGTTMRLQGHAELIFGLLGSLVGGGLIDGATYEFTPNEGGAPPLVAHRSARLSGLLKGTGKGIASFSSPKVERNSMAIFEFSNGATAVIGSPLIYGTLINRGHLTMSSADFVNFSSTLDGKVTEILGPPGTALNTAGARLTLAGLLRAVGPDAAQINNEGEVIFDDGAYLDGIVLRNSPSGMIVVKKGPINEVPSGLGSPSRIENGGTFIADTGTTGTSSLDVQVTLDNTGVVEARSGTTSLSRLKQYDPFSDRLTGGTYRVLSGATLEVGSILSSGRQIKRNLADVRLDGAEAQFAGLDKLEQNDGKLAVRGGSRYNNTSSTFSNCGDLTVTGDDSSAAFAGNVQQQFDSGVAPTLQVTDLGEMSVGQQFNVHTGSVDVVGGTVNVGGGLVMGDPSPVGGVIRLNLDENGQVIVGGDVTIGQNATLSGGNGGTINATSTVNITGGTVAPGQSPGLLTIDAPLLDFGPEATFEVEIGGASPEAEYDQLVTTGDVMLDGKLELDFIGGFAPQAGEQYDLLLANGNLAGMFSDVEVLGLIPGFEFDLTTDSGILKLLALSDAEAIALPGDFGGDGVVDGLDFLLWQRDRSVGDLDVWQANYGTARTLAQSAIVPEPTTALLFLVMSFSAQFPRRHSGSP